jgi:uncharacterized protein (DUF2267 family)
MTVPLAYLNAGDDFLKLLMDARDEAMLQTHHQSFTMVDAVLQIFGRKLDESQAIRFAGVLPPAVRALFIAGWRSGGPREAFSSRADMTRDVQRVRGDHNVSPESAIRDVARALRKHVDGPSFDAVLATLPKGAVDFWRV